MCQHLDRLVQGEPSTSVKAIPTGKIDKFYYESGAGYVIPKEIRDRTWEMQFREKLSKTGLEQVKIDILVCKFVYDMSLSDISEELGAPSISTVLRLLSDSLKYLKKVRFSK